MQKMKKRMRCESDGIWEGEGSPTLLTTAPLWALTPARLKVAAQRGERGLVSHETRRAREERARDRRRHAGVEPTNLSWPFVTCVRQRPQQEVQPQTARSRLCQNGSLSKKLSLFWSNLKSTQRSQGIARPLQLFSLICKCSAHHPVCRRGYDEQRHVIKIIKSHGWLPKCS